MGRSPCCSKEGLNRGAWTAHEDKILRDFISVHGEGRWRNLPKRAGLKRCGKSCRLRWLNYLRPDIKRGNISPDEEELIVRLHKLLGNRWSLIAGRLPGRTDNEIKNYWNTNLGKKLKSHPHPHHHHHHQKNNVASSTQPKTTLTETTPKNRADPFFDNTVVRTKATKCSKVIITTPPPNPQADPPCHQPVIAAADDGGDNTAPPYHYHGDLLMADFNVGEICLSDLLNSDFSDMCDFSNNSVDGGLSPSPEQPPFVFSDEALNDWTQSNMGETDNVDNNLHSLTSLLESSEEWLAS